MIKQKTNLYVMLPCKKPTKKGKHQRCFKEEETSFFCIKLKYTFTTTLIYHTEKGVKVKVSSFKANTCTKQSLEQSQSIYAG
jgi:hypothetical protein